MMPVDKIEAFMAWESIILADFANAQNTDLMHMRKASEPSHANHRSINSFVLYHQTAPLLLVLSSSDDFF